MLYSGAIALLKAGQGGSGGDLALLLVDTLVKGEVEVGGDIKGWFWKLLALSYGCRWRY